MIDSIIRYFDSPGKRNTDQVMDAVTRRLELDGITHIVVASNSGYTVERLLSRVGDRPINVVAVTHHCGFKTEGECEMGQDVEDSLRSKGVRIVRASHVLSGIERSITRKLGGASRVEVISESLRALFGQGLKVCVEITVMAADTGAIPCGDLEVMAIGGTGTGADTACVVRPAHANSFFDFEIREILAIPRIKRKGKRK
ncbi:MAG: hypothetical protein IH630_07960 [Thermoplasmata archaeon]|nr:hypothetical protein [Thermoplasmata archaeon]